MNTNIKLYRQLRALGVYPEPARDICRRFPDPEDTGKVTAAYLSHVRETSNIKIAVWRLQHGILLTEGATIDNLIALRDPPTPYHPTRPNRQRPQAHRPHHIRHSTFHIPHRRSK